LVEDHKQSPVGWMENPERYRACPIPSFRPKLVDLHSSVFLSLPEDAFLHSAFYADKKKEAGGDVLIPQSTQKIEATKKIV
jgi:hypothetical protein